MRTQVINYSEPLIDDCGRSARYLGALNAGGARFIVVINYGHGERIGYFDEHGIESNGSRELRNVLRLESKPWNAPLQVLDFERQLQTRDGHPARVIAVDIRGDHTFAVAIEITPGYEIVARINSVGQINYRVIGQYHEHDIFNV